MKSAAAAWLLPALGLLAAACGSGASSNARDGSGTGTGGSSGTGTGGRGGAPEQCQVNILPVSPASFAGLVAGPDARLRVRGQITGLPAPTFSWLWQVTFADGAPVGFSMVGSDPSLVELALGRPGSYTISVDLHGAIACGGRRTVLVAETGGKLATFRFRFTPAPDGDPVQEQEIQVIGGTPSGGNVLVLSAGTVVTLDPRDAAAMQPAAAYLRLTDPAQRLVIEARRAAGAAPVALRLGPGTFDLLVVPDGDLAPVLLAGRRPADLAGLGPLPLDQGQAVTGQVRDAAGPVAGASVVLRAGSLPSTLATTGGGGTFTLRASPGSYAATVTRPLPGMTAGTLQAVLPATPGVAVTAGAGTGLAVQIGSYATATLTVRLAPNDAAPVTAGTRVVLESAPLAGLTSFTVGGETRAVAARLRGEAAPDAAGSVSIAGLPRAHYRATVVPGPGMPDAITPVADLDLSGGDLQIASLPMRRKVPLSGNLLPGALSGGIALTAVDMTGDFPIAVASVTDPQGSFQIAVNPERTYALRARPGFDRAVAQAVFAGLTVSAVGLVIGDQSLPPALLYAGQVLDHFAKNGAPATLVQVYCEGSAPDCADPETPVAETVTASDGTFALRLPDPGTH